MHSEYVTFIAFHGNNSYANAPQFYVYTYIVRLACLVEMLMLMTTVGIERETF